MSQRMNHEKRRRLDRRVAGFYTGVPPMPKPRYREDPATDKQIEYLQMLRAHAGMAVLDKISCLKLTKSAASQMIKDLRDRK